MHLNFFELDGHFDEVWFLNVLFAAQLFDINHLLVLPIGALRGEVRDLMFMIMSIDIRDFLLVVSDLLFVFEHGKDADAR